MVSLSNPDKLFTAKTVVNVVAHYGDLVLASPFFNHKPLIFYRPVGISVKNRQPDIAYSIFADRNSQFRMLSAFSCHDIHLPYTKRTMAQTIALEGIISCSVFHFHEVTLIFRFHELRHTSATTKLLMSGGDYNSVMQAGGWSNLEMLTRRYGKHSFASEREKLAGKMDDFLDGKGISEPQKNDKDEANSAEQVLQQLMKSNPELLIEFARSIQNANKE